MKKIIDLNRKASRLMAAGSMVIVISHLRLLTYTQRKTSPSLCASSPLWSLSYTMCMRRWRLVANISKTSARCFYLSAFFFSSMVIPTSTTIHFGRWQNFSAIKRQPESSVSGLMLTLYSAISSKKRCLEVVYWTSFQRNWASKMSTDLLWAIHMEGLTTKTKSLTMSSRSSGMCCGACTHSRMRHASFSVSKSYLSWSSVRWRTSNTNTNKAAKILKTLKIEGL